MNGLLRLLGDTAWSVWITFTHVWIWLAVGVVSASALSVYVGADRVGAWLQRRTAVATVASVGAAVLTPFCSCGTTAVVLSMIAGSAPWAPIVAFMVASPLTSPAQVFLSAGLFGWPFTLLFFAGTTLIGLAAGAAAGVAQRLGWLQDQARFTPPTRTFVEPPQRDASLGPGAAHFTDFPNRRDLQLVELAREIRTLGWRMTRYFLGFAALGYLIINIVPDEAIRTVLGEDSAQSVFLAATAGIPLYITTDASLPFVAELMRGGMSGGAAMAFLVTGAGTSLGALSGAMLIARWRVLAIVVGSLWVGAVTLGFVAQALL